MDHLSVSRPTGTAPPPTQRGVLTASVAVPFAIVAGGAAASLVDVRLLLLAGVVLLGWSQLVGL
jgi:hypothetical protein